jgi:hypothetical protein
MKMIKKVLIGLMLSSAATAAFAKHIEPDPYFVEVTFGQDYRQYFDFGAGGADVQAGDTFTYNFLFNTMPEQPEFFFDIAQDHAGDVAFSDAQLLATGDPYTNVDGFPITLTNTTIHGFGSIDAGVYNLLVSGTFLADGAGFTGEAVSDVPEPMSLALVGAGLAGMAGLRRRKVRAKAA